MSYANGRNLEKFNLINTIKKGKEYNIISFSSLQDRLDGVLTNLEVQAENLRAMGSRVSDVSVANELINFTQTSIMTNQANSEQQNSLRILG